MEWTTQAPKEPGWYWASDKKYSDDHVVMVEVVHDGIDSLIAYTSDRAPWELSDFTHWQGPIPKPAPPDEITETL